MLKNNFLFGDYVTELYFGKWYNIITEGEVKRSDVKFEF